MPAGPAALDQEVRCTECPSCHDETYVVEDFGFIGEHFCRPCDSWFTDDDAADAKREWEAD